MRPLYFKLVALLSLVLHFADPALTLLSHNHHEEGGKHAEVVHSCGHGSHSHAAGSCGHHRSHTAPAEEQQSDLPDHDHSNCAACQHMAQAAAELQFTIEFGSAELHTPLFLVETRSAFKLPVLRHRSRAPPAMIG